MKIETITPEIFPKDRIISGVVKKNLSLIPKTGLSFSEAETLTTEEVERHKAILADSLGVPGSSFVWQKQVHGTRIRLVDFGSPTEESDGMITGKTGLFLGIKIADCAAVLAFDPVERKIGAFHSGWRGSAEKIVQVGVEKMRTHWGCRPKNMLFYISPCASGELYEVGPEVAERFPKSTKPIGNDKFLFDNKLEIFDQLIEIGALKGNVEISPLCTIADPDLHSYRRDRAESGRMAAFVAIKNQ